MDRSLQERLIGAAVLVALGVWLIPWVLDGSDSADSADSEPAPLQLPVPERTATTGNDSLRRQTIELGAPREAADRSADAASPDALSSDAVPTQSQTASNSGPAAQSAPDGTAAKDAKDDRAAAAAAPPNLTSGAAPGATSGATERAAGDGEPGRAAPVRRSDPPSSSVAVEADAPQTGWMVQLGSFSDAGNAGRQADRIKTFGHAPRIFEFSAGGRTMYRVRLGPVPTRERAEATASSLSAHGFVAQVVAPDTAQ